MALITCPDCGGQTSDAAVACPGCARPIAATTIEQTGKRWKALSLGGLLAMFGGCVMTWAAGAANASPVLGVAVMLAGVAAFFGARAGAWWEHG